MSPKNKIIRLPKPKIIHLKPRKLVTPADIPMDSLWKMFPHTMMPIVSGGELKPYRHLQYLSKVMARTIGQGNGRLLLSGPPRHFKSYLTSLILPVWFLEMFPNKKVIVSSYNDDFAKEWGGKIRDMIENNKAVLNVRLNPRARGSGHFETTDGGEFNAAGIGGGLIGKGGDLIILDDPIKNWEEAFSKVYQEKLFNWYLYVLKTRVNPKGGTIIINMARWNKPDLIGRLKDGQDPEDTYIPINLPAMAMQYDILGRKEGEPLCPEQMDLDALLRKKKGLPRLWNGPYQGIPSAEEGELWKRSYFTRRYLEVPGMLDETIITGDMNMKKGEENDFTVFGCWSSRGADIYLRDVLRFNANFNEQVEQFKRFCIKWPMARTKLIEDAANAAALLETVKSKIRGVRLIKPDGSKIGRAMAAEPFLAAMNVLLPADELANPWVPKFIDECANFPNDEHDDQVDMAAYALLHFDKKTRNNIADAYKW